MRFAILGDHPDGKAVAAALPAAGHELRAYQGRRPQDWPHLKATADLEEVLADPTIDAVIVAGDPGERLNQLRRVLQSERSALVVHPVDEKPDGGHEIAMLLGDVHQVAIPILPGAVSAGVAAFAKDCASATWVDLVAETTGAQVWEAGARPSFPGWTELRRAGGEIVEVAAFAPTEEILPGDVVMVHGRFADGRLFRALYVPRRPATTLELRGPGRKPLAEYADSATWVALARRFDDGIARLQGTPRAAPGAGSAVDLRDGLSWLDEIRALELDDAVRQSVKRRRAMALDFQEANEEVGFKGAMTLVGCGLVWLLPILLLVAAWLPGLFWILVASVFGFLLLQAFRWIVPAGNRQAK